MKTNALLLFSVLIATCSYSQSEDTLQINNASSVASRIPFQSSSVPSLNSAHGANWWAVVAKENISIKTHTLQLSAVENEITDLESRECGALKKRDTLALMRLWARDFTVRETQNEVVNSKNGLSNYLSLTRMIEAITVIDSNTVYTSGVEMFREIRSDRKTNPEETRKYLHIWTKKNGLWKLTTKRTG